MDWSKGYTTSYYMTIVDPLTWRDISKINITGGSISRSLDSLRESASIDCETFDLGIEQWIRVYMRVEQIGSSENIPIFTGLASAPNSDREGNIENFRIQCYSVLKAVDDIGLLRGWYAPAGMRGSDVIKGLFSSLAAPVDIYEDSPVLTSNIIAEDGETNLTMIDKVLNAMGDWWMQIRGDGSISIEPRPTDAAAIFDQTSFDVIETRLSIEEDWFSCPNVLMLVNDDITSIARDDLDTSPVSTVNRGREVWVMENGGEYASEESNEQYAIRRLKELQRVYRKVSYDRRYVPDVYPGNYIYLRYPEFDMEGTYFIESQNIDLSYSATTSETVSIIVEG